MLTEKGTFEQGLEGGDRTGVQWGESCRGSTASVCWGGDARHGELGVPTERKEPDARAQTRSEDRGDGTAGVRRRWG